MNEPTPADPATARRRLAEGIALHRSGRIDDAEQAYKAALRRDPRQADALHMLGVIAHQRGDQAGGLALIDRAIAIEDSVAVFHCNRGVMLKAMKAFDAAIASYDRAIALQPDYADAHAYRANALKSSGRMREALASYDRAIALRPNDAGAHYDRGVLLRAAHRPEAALASYDRAVALRPDWPELHVNRGNALRDLDRLDEAAECFQTAIRLRPGLAEAHANLGACLSRLGFVDEAMACFRTALRIIPAPERPRMPWLMTLNALDTITPAEIARAHRDMAAELARLSPPPRVHPPRIRAPGQPLRIGYVSPDLHTHSVAYFFEPVLSAHDPAAVATVCYHCGTLNDGTTRRLRAAAGQWRDAAVLDDDALAAQIAADRIDILVDLAGHTRGNRLAVFQRKPAPVQVTWIGYPNTTGMDTVDYRITDAIADPPGEDDRLHAETLIRLPRGFLCYRPPDGAPDVPPRPIATAEPGEVTFGSFNNLTKIGPAVIAAWSRILHRAPRSRLLLKAAGLGSPRARDRLHREFAAQGVAPERVALLATTATRDAHLASYGQVDIALDSFPYNGTTTTCEALWMGVPVVALRGNRHAARVGASLLHRLGLDDLVAADIDGYVAIACALAADAARVARLGTELRARMLGSPLCDAAGFVRDLEAAYVAMAEGSPKLSAPADFG